MQPCIFQSGEKRYQLLAKHHYMLSTQTFKICIVFYGASLARVKLSLINSSIVENIYVAINYIFKYVECFSSDIIVLTKVVQFLVKVVHLCTNF